MGYTTDFEGGWEVTPTLTPEHKAYLEKFRDTRRMKRDPSIVATLSDPVREAVGLGVGVEGGFYVGGGGGGHEEGSESVIDWNDPPFGQPGLWCQWAPNEEGNGIEWDGGEKFYDYVEWIQYLIGNFLGPWGYVLNGEVSWSGEEPDDLGQILIVNNEVKVGEGRVVYDYR